MIKKIWIRKIDIIIEHSSTIVATPGYNKKGVDQVS